MQHMQLSTVCRCCIIEQHRTQSDRKYKGRLYGHESSKYFLVFSYVWVTPGRTYIVIQSRTWYY